MIEFHFQEGTVYSQWVSAQMVVVSGVGYFFSLTELLVVSLYLDDFCS